MGKLNWDNSYGILTVEIGCNEFTIYGDNSVDVSNGGDFSIELGKYPTKEEAKELVELINEGNNE